MLLFTRVILALFHSSLQGFDMIIQYDLPICSSVSSRDPRYTPHTKYMKGKGYHPLIIIRRTLTLSQSFLCMGAKAPNAKGILFHFNMSLVKGSITS
jgi:hypothetical protein